MKINGQEWVRGGDLGPALERNDPALKKLEGYSGGYGSSMDVMLKLVAKHFKGNRYLEVGTFDGIVLSMLAWTYPMREFHAIDNFAEGYATESGCLRYFIENNERNKNVFLHVGTTVNVKLEGKFGMILIDGDHSYEWVKIDAQTLWPFLEVGGVMVFHDYDHEAVKRAVTEVMVSVEKFEHGEFMFTRK